MTAAARVDATREKLAFDPANLPIKIGLWYILIAPVRPPEKTAGGLALAKETKDAEEALTSVGKILDMGDFAYKSRTPSGLDLSTDSRKPEVGDFVLYQQYAGHRVKMRDGRLLVILSDTEILGVVPVELVPQLQFYL